MNDNNNRNFKRDGTHETPQDSQMMESESKSHLAVFSALCLSTPSTTPCLDEFKRIPTERELRALTRTRMIEERADRAQHTTATTSDPPRAQDTAELTKQPTRATNFEGPTVICEERKDSSSKLHTLSSVIRHYLQHLSRNNTTVDLMFYLRPSPYPLIWSRDRNITAKIMLHENQIFRNWKERTKQN
jgi:hypothetical protein